jgi:hypothetical protein
MWNARKLPGRVPPIITGITVGTGLYYLCQTAGLGAHLGDLLSIINWPPKHMQNAWRR